MQFLWLACLTFFISFQWAHAAPPASEFGKLPAIYDAAISPDASQIAVFVNIKGTYGVRVFDLKNPGGKVRAILLGKGVKPKWVKWANNDRVLVSIWQSEDLYGTPITSSYIYTLDAKTMKGKYLIKPPRDVVRQYNDVVIDFLEDDPDHILMSFSDEDSFAPHIQKVDVKTGKSKRIKRGTTSIQYWHSDLRGEPRIGQGRYDSEKIERWRLTIRDADTDKWRKGDEFPNLSPDVDIYGFTSNPNEMIIGARNGKSTMGLYIYDLNAKKQTRKLFHSDDYDAGSVVLSSDGSEVVGVSYTSDTKQIEMLDGYKSVLQKLREKLPSHHIQFQDQSRDDEITLFKASNAFDPGQLLMRDNNTGKISALAHYRAGLKQDDLGLVVPVNYKARDKFSIPAYITLPPTINDAADIKNLPFIILPHGGPYARSSQRFDYFAQFFATRGYGVLQMNFRGSAGYGKTFEDAGRDNWVLMQEDVEDGARWLIRKGYADPKRMCIAGWSYGGYAALMGAIKTPELYACSVSMAGVTDLKDLVNDAKKYRFGAIGAKNSILRGFEDKDAIKENSPVKRADEITIPLFLAHGTADQRVHFDQYKRMKRALKKGPAKVTYMEFKNEDHFLSSEANRIEFFKGLEKFLNKTMGESEFKKG